jgi:tetratricopeptide (TPR) repeat protein
MTVDREARNAAIQFHNQSLAVVGTDKPLAYRLLCSAVTVDPDMAQGWYMLSNACADLKLFPASIAAARRCLACPMGDAPGDLTEQLRAKTMVNLGHRYFQNGDVREAMLTTKAAIGLLDREPDLDPEGRAFAHTNMSLILSVQGRVDAALEEAKRGFELNPTPINETGLGFGYLFAGDYAHGLKHFDARFAYKAELNSYLSWPFPRWQGERVGALFVAADQGIGDTLSMARFVIPAAQAAEKVMFQVPPEIVSLMALAMKPLGNVEVMAQSAGLVPADAWVPVVSLPVALGLTSEQIRAQPQGWWIDVPPADPVWKAKGAKFHIGIAYGGSPKNEIDIWRSAPLHHFLTLAEIPGVQLYSLQVGDRAQDIHAIGAAALIRDMSPWIRDAMDTAAIMQQLDVIVTIDSFVGHLVGALSRPCYTLVSRLGGDWRLGRSGNKPLWYDNTHLIRQGDDGRWEPVFERLFGLLHG